MKKVLLVLIAVFMAVPAFAVEVYNNGEGNSVDIYGTIRGYIGYGAGITGETKIGGVSLDDSDTTHNFLYGVQPNSRIGVKLALGNFSGQVELGANEATVYGVSAGNAVGLRQAWAAYSFGNAGKLLAGKTDTPTSMGGFISDIFDTDGGLNGFGGVTTSTRRFQVSYTIAGFTLALIEDDVLNGNAGGFIGTNKYTPRGAISYTYKNENLMAKVAATYTAVNGEYIDDGGNVDWTNLHAFGITAGVRPTFSNNRMWLSVLLRYGMNEDLYGEAKTVVNNGKATHDGLSLIDSEGNVFGVNDVRSVKDDGSFYNIHRVAVSAEYGAKLTEQFALVVGAGYQATIPEAEDVDYLISSFAVFLQGNYAISKNFAFIPQIAYYGTMSEISDDIFSAMQSGVLVGAQIRASF